MRGDQDVPAEDRHAVERHARRAHLQDRDDDLHGQRQRRDLDEGHAKQPDVRVDARRIDVRAQRRVHEPAAVGRDPGDQRHGQDRAAEQVAPVAIGGQPREGEVARAENLRRQVDREALHHRDGEQEQHHRPVHGEDLVVGLRIHEVRLGRRELHTGQHAEHAGDGEEHERRDHHAHADDGMVDSGETLQSRARWPRSRRAGGAAATPVPPCGSCSTDILIFSRPSLMQPPAQARRRSPPGDGR